MQQLPQGQANGGAAAATTHAPETASLKSLVRNVTEETERTATAAALTETHWNRKAAARLLKISYRALLYKIEHHQMRPPQL
jgi:DNA-binding NtrC family response regulator